MPWIKRNLIFVLGLAVGVLLIAGAVYYTLNILKDNENLTNDFKQNLSDLQAMQNKTPAPSEENIQSAKKQQEQMREFVRDFRLLFSPFPRAASTDDKAFSAYLAK